MDNSANIDVEFYSIKNKIVLLCNSYPVHFSKEAKEFAQELNIQLVQVPEGLTRIFQPLDHRVFEVLKNQKRSFLNMKIVEDILQLFNPDEGELKKRVKPIILMSKKGAVAMLECSWNRITEDLIIEAWNEAIIKNISINASIEEINILYVDEDSLEQLKTKHHDQLIEYVRLYDQRQENCKSKKKGNRTRLNTYQAQINREQQQQPFQFNGMQQSWQQQQPFSFN
ncbi:hypothetical protein M9Y10_010475 [Tritrichomonas musculus]|uniref:DDE-1 domain-containing protein n=1 Tax=Tritrichomonas musculus TaxID=1915356 RepID=A0ABR2IKZ3_9EUKA